MARINISSILTFLTVSFLLQLCQASLISRAALIARNADPIEEASPQITNVAGAAIGKLQAELAAKLSFKDSAIRLLSGEGPRAARRELQTRTDDLEDIRQQLANIDQVIANLRDLISAFLANSTTTTTSTATATSTTSATTSATTASTGTPTNTNYVFNPTSTANVAAYYGQTDQSGNVPFVTLCNDPNVDIIVLAFINKLSTSPEGWPGLNVGAKCWAPTQAQVDAGAADLVDCVGSGFNNEVRACQNQGKKVLLSIGGAVDYSDTTIESNEDAVRIAENIWNLFGPAGLYDDNILAIRPFGDVILDGFDIDNEDGSTQYWNTLITTLRSYFTSYPSKPYYLAATPQCPRPDASIPLTALQSQIDYIFIQFYNNPSCNLDSTSSTAFLASLTGWANDVGPDAGGPPFVDVGNGNQGPRVFVGAPAFPAAALAGGFVSGTDFVDILQLVVQEVGGGFGIGNFGGVMFWDGAYGELGSASTWVASTGLGKTWMQLAKEAFA